MSDVRTEEFSEPRLNINLRVSDDARGGAAAGHPQQPDTGQARIDTTAEAPRRETTAKRGDSRQEAQPDDDRRTQLSEASMVRVRRQNRLPALDDDAEVGVQKEHIVTRDGKADLMFTGV